ncbi:unnamed protein product [Cyclocybe aegerita]|uniref:Uncharacterized protein n=1 Tax=Cyclocybe aegerita TaxID=1973307 RepID=A0A8S0XRF9_CYCAE|nr:unnamed protein product [Cyclocybe aegerita]
MIPGRRQISCLPDDVLRQLFETASRGDRKTALALALASRASQHWIDEVLYSEVVLRSKNATRLFLRTIQTSHLKPPTFFSTVVKTLVICPDLGPSSISILLSTCRSIVNLSYWPLRPSSTALPEYHFGDSTVSSTLGLSAVLGPPFAPHQNINTSSPNPQNVTFEQALLPSPRRLSVIFQEEHSLPYFRPPLFRSPFLSNVTHLSVVNPWEEWTLWVQAGMLTSAMPSLTHVKFELCVGQEPSGPQDLPSPWSNKITKVADALTDVLQWGLALRVCVLVLRFDIEPTKTAKFISHLTFPKPPISEEDAADMTREERQKPGFDARLVFAWEKEPFRYNYAHSVQERKLWKAAEMVVNAQRITSGYGMLNCDRLP